MSQPVTPGQDRVVMFQILGGQFGYRRPSRADLAEVHRRFVAKLTISGLPVEADLLNGYDGQNLLWEARLEVGLLPIRLRNGQQLHLGERAPQHWLEEVSGAVNGTRDQVISFAQVTPEEFAQVAAYLDEQIFKKKAENPPPPISTGSASSPTSA